MAFRASFGVGVVIVLGVMKFISLCGAYPSPYAPGYSYSKFSGPVSGPEHEIYVTDKHGHPQKDYVAKPDYHFAYGVEDPKSKVSQSRKETRLGDAVHGEYSVVDPDGTVRTVKYTADKKNGFQAQVYTNGKMESAHVNTGSDGGESSHSHSSHENSGGGGGGEGDHSGYEVDHSLSGEASSSSEESYDHDGEDEDDDEDEDDE